MVLVSVSAYGVPQVPPAASSISHTALQPSPARLLPSSHCSPFATSPSPQRAPLDSLEHEDEQPSPLARLPSSHCSEPSFTPSPHAGGSGLSVPALLQAASRSPATSVKRAFIGAR